MTFRLIPDAGVGPKARVDKRQAMWRAAVGESAAIWCFVRIAAVQAECSEWPL